MRKYLWLTVILVLVGLTACAPLPTLMNDAYLPDTSLIDGEPCLAPCWQDLTVGDTAWGVAQDFIGNNDLYTEVDRGNDRRTGEAWIEFAYQDGPLCCRLYTSDQDTLDSILLLLAPQMTAGEVIDSYGEPAYMTGQAETADQAYVALIYPEQPMVVYTFAEDLVNSDLTPESTVIGAVFLAADEMDVLLQSQNLYNWDGYGNLGDVIDGFYDLTPVPAADDD